MLVLYRRLLDLYQRLTDSHLRAALLASAVSLGTKLATVGIGFGVTVLIARRFGAAGSGTWVLATTFLMIASYLGLCGLDYGTTRAIAIFRAEERWSGIRSWTLTGLVILGTAGSVVAVAAWLASPLIIKALAVGPDFKPILATMCLAIVPGCALKLLGGLFRGSRRFAVAEALDGSFVPASLALCAFTVGLHDLHQVATVYLGATTLAAILGLGIWYALLGDKGRPAEPLMVRDALTRSLPMAGTVLALMASPWILTIALARFASTADVGIFRVSMQFMLLLSLLLGSAETALAPQIAALHSQRMLKELLNSTKHMTLLLIVGGGIPALILVIFAGSFLSILGPEFPRGAMALRILILGQMVNLASGPIGSYMAMTGRGRSSFRNALVGVVIVLVLSFFLIPLYGTNGAAVAWSSATIYRNVALSWQVWRKYGLFLPLGLAREGTQPFDLEGPDISVDLAAERPVASFTAAADVAAADPGLPQEAI
jgi:O-antigen/teichoic acid export membrane protein